MDSVFHTKEKRPERKVQRERAVLTLFTEGHASREGIQRCLEEISGEHVSFGEISAIIHEGGKRAQAYLKRLIPAGERILALDEQYGGKRGEGYLNIVDVWSSLVLASVPPVAVDGDSWKLLLWQMQEQGIKWKRIVSDGGRAIQDAVYEVTPDQVHQRDNWHVLHECQKVQGRVDRSAQKLHDQALTVERQAKRVAAGQKPLGRNPKTDVVAHAKDVHQMDYVASSLHYLSSELQRLLEIVVLTEKGILGTAERQEELHALMDLFSELCKIAPKNVKNDLEKLFHHVQFALPGLLGFWKPLDAVQQKVIDRLGEAALHLIGWAWQRRALLELNRDQLVAAFPPSWQPEARAVLRAWDEAVRSSSVVENWHSILRPHLAVHRHLSADMLAILAVWHNHRVAPRGVHKGMSPLMRSGLAKEPTDWLEALGYPSASLIPRHVSSSRDASQLEIESTAA